MAKILFATDFSPVAQNAATYALHLAHYLGQELELFHAYIIPFAYTDSPVPLLNVDEIQEIAEGSMDIEYARLKGLMPDMQLTKQIMPGDIIECLKEKIELESPMLIVMGTSGDGSDSILWGSIAVKALRSFSAPVLAVPAKAVWKPVSRICFAADYAQVSDQTPLAEISGWVGRMHAGLLVLHVDSGAEQTPPSPILIEHLQMLNPEYHSIIHEKMDEGVQNFLLHHQVDWLILIPRKYGFFENIFHKSRTKMLAQVSHVPILALHQEG
jgi:nucleotide-binding universal stress UspA family protein